MPLTIKQKELMDLLFDGKPIDDALLQCSLTKGLYVQWSASPAWVRAYEERMDELKKQTITIIGAFQPVAAVKLIALMDSEKEETARHACLDVLRLGSGLDFEDETAELPILSLSKEHIANIREILAHAKKTNKKKNKSTENQNGEDEG